MNSSNKNIIIVVVAVIIMATVLILFINRTQSPYHWTESLQKELPQPYDIGLLHSLLKSGETQKLQTSQEALSNYMDTLDNVNYLFLNHSLILDSLDAYTLTEFVRRGNDALIITSNLPNTLHWALQDEDIWLSYYNSMEAQEINLITKDNDAPYRVHYRKGDKKMNRYWRFSTDSLNYENTELLGYFKEKGYDYTYQNFYSVDIGEGKMYFHTEPLLFTNYYLSTTDGFNYVGEVFGHLKNRPILWDNFHHNYYGEDSRHSSSAMRYILAQPSLRYAWYSLVAGLFLFLIFYSKRRQRIIPLIPKVENTSIEFAKSLGTLYYQSETPRHLAKEMLKLFDNHNRKRYGISRDFKNKDAAAEIARKSKTDLKTVENIIDLERKILYNPSAKMSAVVELYEALEKFYKNKK